MSKSDEASSKRRLSVTPEKPNPKKANVIADKPHVNIDVDVVKMGQEIVSSLKDPGVLSDLTKNIVQGVLAAVVPKLQISVQEALTTAINDAVLPMQKTISDQDQKIKGQNYEIKTLQKRVQELQSRAEEQEQYSRRNCLRFSNVPFVDAENEPLESARDLNTDEVVLDICNNTLGLSDITVDDISRSHVVGKPSNGTCQIIARFNSYRTRHKVYSAKSNMKTDPQKRYINEDLTKYRYAIVKRLAKERKAKRIDSFWTFDGRIFCKVKEKSPKVLVKSLSKVDDLLANVSEPFSDTE